MATVTDTLRRSHPAEGAGAASGLLEWLTTTDHKRIGLLYMSTAIVFFLIAGLMALVMRAELAQPGLQFLTPEGYDELFTMHGTLMLLAFGTPAVAAFANYLLPLQVGTAEMAFPRLNALSYWLYVLAGIILMSSFLTIGGAANGGWTAYVPNTEAAYSPGAGMDLWIVSLLMLGISTILGAINFLTTAFTRRAPGMTMLRLPMFTWMMIVTSGLILFAFPPLTAALVMLYMDRHLGTAVFEPALGGNAVLYQHLVWFFGHPEVYILALPFFGIVSEIIPVFSRKPLFGYRFMVLAGFAIAALSMGVWAHHMFTTGVVNLPFFSIMSFTIAVPTGIKLFNWIATMWRGQLRFPTPMLWAVGVIYIFVVGGISGVMVASPPLDFDFQDTYFVVAHFHNVLIGSTVFATFAGIYFWFPKATGRFLDERLGKLHFWSWVIGFGLTFLPMYELGALGMPRRIVDYAPATGWGDLNLLATIGSLVLGLGTIPFLVALVRAFRQPRTASDDPWEANSLEWATSSPPPHHNFRHLPPIRSERPVFDARLAARQAASRATGPEGGGPSQPTPAEA